MSHKSLHRAAGANRAAEAVALRRAALQRVWPDGTRARPCADTPAVLPISEERAAYALQAADVGIWEIDLRTEGLACSETIASLLGVKLGNPPRTAAEFIAQVHPDDRPAMKAFLLGPKRVGVDYHAEFRVLRPEGGPRWMASRARLFPDDTGRPVRLLGIATDIDDRRMLALQLGRAQKIESVGQLTAGLVHDFNNLLTVILAYSGLVMGTLEPGDPRCADMEQVMKAGHQAGGLTRQLLAFIRKQGGKPTTLDLNILVANMLEMLSRLLGPHVELLSTLAPDIAEIRADAGQIEQLLMNLVINARDAMPSGGRLTVGTALVNVAGESVGPNTDDGSGAYVVLMVSDTGMGIAEETRVHLFEPFFTTKVDGTGLGLAVVQGIVRQSRGYIRVLSEVGKGTTFKVFLPAVTPSACDCNDRHNQRKSMK